MVQSKTWGSHTSRSECLALLPLFIQRLWSLFYPKEILILCVMLECLLSLTRRRAKSQTSTGTHPLFLLLCYLFFFFSFFFLVIVLSLFWMSSLMFLVICRKQQQQVDRGDFSPCGTPTGLDARDHQFDLQLGSWTFHFVVFSDCALPQAMR